MPWTLWVFVTKWVTRSPGEGHLEKKKKKSLLLEPPLVLANKDSCLKPCVLWRLVLRSVSVNIFQSPSSACEQVEPAVLPRQDFPCPDRNSHGSQSTCYPTCRVHQMLREALRPVTHGAISGPREGDLASWSLPLAGVEFLWWEHMTVGLQNGADTLIWGTRVVSIDRGPENKIF